LVAETATNSASELPGGVHQPSVSCDDETEEFSLSARTSGVTLATSDSQGCPQFLPRHTEDLFDVFNAAVRAEEDTAFSLLEVIV
jgi:hypothetical protein